MLATRDKDGQWIDTRQVLTTQKAYKATARDNDLQLDNAF